MTFSTVIFIAALWALSSEMVEDSLVDLIYGHIYGWRTLLYALIAASAILTTVSAVSVFYALTILARYIGLVTEASAILLGAIGFFWLASSLLGQGRESELEEARRAGRVGGSQLGKFLVALQLVTIEELEILLIVVPLVIASHALEASAAAVIGIIASLSTAAILRRRFEKLVAGKLRYLKIASGTFLLGLAVILFLEA